MMPKKTALIMEGGGFRGIYTSGVLDYFMEQELTFPYLIGVSMGAVNGINYVSNQPERSIEIARTYSSDKRYMGMGNLIKEGNFFGRNFAYNEIPRRYILFDMKTYYESKQQFFMVATDCETGKARYFEKMEHEVGDLVAASTALPFMSRPVVINGRFYLDGGIADSIPIRKALADGNEKAVVILTREKGYRKPPYGHEKMVRVRYHKYPAFAEAVLNRHLFYNQTMDLLDELEAAGSIYILRPKKPIQTKVIDRDAQGIEKSYHLGYEQCATEWDRLMRYLK